MSHQAKIRNTVAYLIKLFNEIDLHYWIDFGTLLGAVREGDIIAWDIDADFSIPQGEAGKIYPYIGRILQETDLVAVTCHDDGALKLMPYGTPWHIDIYPWVSDGWRMRHPRACFGIKPWPIADIEKPRTMKFLGLETKIPYRTEIRLTRLYGDYMTPVKKVPYWS